MKFKVVAICFYIFYSSFISAQGGFNFEDNKSKIKIPFKLINNLIIIPLQVNGVDLNFLLDTGVEETILFSLDETEAVNFAQIEKIKIKGFGIKEAFDGFKSVLNQVNAKNYIDKNHTVYLVLDQDINISSQIGVPVNGIIGYHFFKNNLVKIDYQNRKLIIFKDKTKQLNRIDKFYSKVPLTFDGGKPYLISKISLENGNQLNAKLLIDTGNSDAIWLFKEKNDSIKLPSVSFEDYLGRGFSGDVFGNRGRIKSFEIATFEFLKPLVSFPNNEETQGVEKIQDRLGSVGSEIMKRFTVYFDYNGNSMYLKKNEDFNDPFNFNMSGIEIQHQGLQWIKSEYEENAAIGNNLYDGNGDKILNNLRYKFELKPVYIISNIRKGSPADVVGLKKDDVIVKINKREGYHYSLQDINDLLKSQEGKIIDFEIDRKGVFFKFKVLLKSML